MAIQTLGSNARGRGLGLNETLRVGTFGDENRIEGGGSELYEITVSGEIREPNTDSNQISNGGKTVTGKVFAPGGFDSVSYTGEVVSANLGPNLTITGATVNNGGSGSGGSGGSGGGNNTGKNKSANQAGVLGGMDASTIAVIGAAGIGAYLISQNS